MPKQRRLSPQSIWDAHAVTEAFKTAGVKPGHLPKLYQ